jgi:hypothetical protein
MVRHSYKQENMNIEGVDAMSFHLRESSIQSGGAALRRSPDSGRIYYGGFDPGSGYSTLFVAPADEPDALRSQVIPSWVSSGTLAEVAKRSGLLNAKVTELLDEGEFVISIEGKEYYAGKLGQQAGQNRTNALNDPRRYSNEHAMALLFALCGLLIPEEHFTLLYVTGLPVSLYKDDDNRYQVQDIFTRNFQFTWNGQPKNGNFVCGTVVPEGAGGLLLYGDTSSLTLVIDYGYRTTDVLTARGQKVDLERSGGFDIGVGQLVDAFNDEFVKIKIDGRTRGRRLDEAEADALLRAYAHGEPLPVIKVNRDPVDPRKVRAILDQVYERIGDQSNTRIAQIVNTDDSALGAAYALVLLIGGGAPHFRAKLEEMIPNVNIVEQAQLANPEGYLEIAQGFREDTWQRVTSEVEARRKAHRYA